MECFNEFAEFGDKKILITVEWLEPATSCMRDRDATTAPARDRGAGSLN